MKNRSNRCNAVGGTGGVGKDLGQTVFFVNADYISADIPPFGGRGYDHPLGSPDGMFFCSFFISKMPRRFNDNVYSVFPPRNLGRIFLRKKRNFYILLRNEELTNQRVFVSRFFGTLYFCTLYFVLKFPIHGIVIRKMSPSGSIHAP